MSDDEQHGPTEGAPPPSPPPPGASPPPGFTGPPPGFASAPPGFGSAPRDGWPPGAPRLPPSVPTAMAPPPSAPARSARPTRSVLLLVLVLLIGLGAAIAGVLALTGGDDDGVEGSPGQAVQALTDATASGDARSFCDALSATARASLADETGLPCTEYVRPRLALMEGSAPAELEILDAEIDGDRATVTYRTGSEEAGELDLVAEEGAWRIDGPLDRIVGPLATDDAPTDAPGPPEGASQACLTELRTVETAVEAYFAQFGEYPADSQALVDAGMLRELPTLAEVWPEGDVYPSGECA